MASMDVPDSSLASLSSVYTAEEWEQKRGLITGLYLNGTSQKEVLSLLARQYNFRPSLQMLKKRIRRWGIDRNNKKSDILAAVRLALRREAQGKRRTEFVMRSRVVKRKEINRYLQRKGIRDVYAFAAGSAEPSSPPPVAAYTPCHSPAIPEASGPDTPNLVGPADPLLDDVEYEVPHEEIGSLLPVIAPLPVRPNIYHVSPPLADAPQLELLRHALVLNRGYYDYISEASNAWRARASNHNMPLDFSECKELKDFTNGMWSGRDLLLEGQVPKAFTCFDHAFASIHGILKNQSRKFLPELYEMLLNFQLDEQQDVLSPLLRYVVKMSRMSRPSLRKSHNISKIASCLLQMNRADRTCSVERLLQNVCHRFQSDLAYDQREALNISKVLSRSIFCRMRLPEAIVYLTNLLQDESVSGVDSYENCLILFELAKCYRFQNLPDDTISWLNKALDKASRLEILHSRTDIKVRCFRALSWAEGKRNNWHLAHGFARHAVELSSSVLGPEDSLTDLVEADIKELEAEIKNLGISLPLG